MTAPTTATMTESIAAKAVLDEMMAIPQIGATDGRIEIEIEIEIGTETGIGTGTTVTVTVTVTVTAIEIEIEIETENTETKTGIVGVTTLTGTGIGIETEIGTETGSVIATATALTETEEARKRASPWMMSGNSTSKARSITSRLRQSSPTWPRCTWTTRSESQASTMPGAEFSNLKEDTF